MRYPPYPLYLHKQYAFLLRKQRIQDFLIQNKMNDEEQQSQTAEQDAQPWLDKEADCTKNIKYSGNVKVSIKGSRMFFESLFPDFSAAAVPLQHTCHICSRVPFALASGGALFHMAADVRDLIQHVRDRLPAIIK